MRLLPHGNEHGWTPYVWLVYLGPYIAFPFAIRSPLSPALTWTAWTSGLAAFLVLYFRGYWVDGRRRLPIIVALALLGAALAAVNPGALMFFTYAAAFVGGAVRPAHAGYWIGALTVTGVISALLSPWEPTWIVSGVAVMTPVIGFVNLHYVETRRREASLKLAHEEIARLATIAERERIAADLHDLLGHTLSVIVLKSELASKLVERDVPRASSEIADVERISRDALTEVRRAVQGFRAARLADELVRARAVLETAGVRADVDAQALSHDNSFGAAARDTEHAVAMIVREAVTNVVRHARATRCHITASTTGDALVVEVADDGVGGPVCAGAGIESMRARAREIGGTLEHRSGRGITVTLRVPRGVLA
jgi:two-component system sensor histidine kinase DesK